MVGLGAPLFKAEHALGARDCLLYAINPDLSPQDPSEIVAMRIKACVLHLNRLTIVECAAVGHPNPAGAQWYAEAILTHLRDALPTAFAAK